MNLQGWEFSPSAGQQDPRGKQQGQLEQDDGGQSDIAQLAGGGADLRRKFAHRLTAISYRNTKKAIRRTMVHAATGLGKRDMMKGQEMSNWGFAAAVMLAGTTLCASPTHAQSHGATAPAV